MNYYCNLLKELGEKATRYRGSLTDAKRKELLLEFLGDLYDAFEVRIQIKKDESTGKPYIQGECDYRNFPVVLADLIDLEKELEQHERKFASAIKKNPSIRFAMLTDGTRYRIYENHDGEMSVFSEIDLTHITDENNKEYYDMRWMNVFSYLEEYVEHLEGASGKS